MRVHASGNLTVELIRAERFDVACREHVLDQQQRCVPCPDRRHEVEWSCVDRVELSPQALASDPWAVDTQRADQAETPLTEAGDQPERLSPIVGSPALGGLGVALVVPGTLLDVVA